MVKRLLIILSLIIILIAIVVSSGLTGLNWQKIRNWLPKKIIKTTDVNCPDTKIKIVKEESIVVDVVDKVSPSVVTIGIVKTRKIADVFEIDPFDPFSIFQLPQDLNRKENIEQDIGTGFIISSDGTIVTNKHVVGDTEAKYKVITKDDKTYEVEKIYRDPVNDLAILKISASGLLPVEMGDSSKLKVGQFVIAIGTALGEFRNTVTTGVISGLGRGINAGSPFESSSEKLENVIQTDAAINPGNSGGPLLNSSDQVIGVSVAIAQSGQNIGFALPVNIIKDSINNFNQTGKFSRPYLGVKYRIISKKLALLNDLPEGAYLQEVVAGSPADKAGIKAEDIITKINGQKLTEENGGLARIIANKKVGDELELTVWRNEKEIKIQATLTEQE